MRALPQWIVWRFEPGKPKPKKVPFSPVTGGHINPLDPAKWMSHAEAVATGHTIGFVFTAADPYFFLDLDACLTPQGWADYATKLVQRFPGAMVETSVSGNGLHVFGRYSGPRPEHGTRHKPLDIELYTADRFVAMGAQATGDCDTDCTAALGVLAAQYFPPTDRGSPADWTDEPRDDWTGSTDDDELIRKARVSGGNASRFGNTASFDDLWTANEEALAQAFPDPSNAWGRNEADAALTRHLAFWTGCDCERIVRLMWQSELTRPKWDRQDYIHRTVSFAVAQTDRVYDHVVDEIRGGYQFLTIEEQAKLFAGCIYVSSRNRVMTADGKMLGPQQFNAVVQCFEFARDATGQTKTTRKPWEAFTESLAFTCPVADEACFDPAVGWDKPIERGGRTYANIYRPIETPRQAGDAGPFLRHLAKLLPVETDRAIVLAYMAAVVQHKGVKFQWCPLIQGVEGNGKTLLTTVLAEAIGDRYTHMAQANDLSGKFNSWLQGKILIGIEDIYAPAARQEILEVLKPMITNGNAIGIQAKGVDQETSRICCNFLINSNHRDAIRKTENDRRFAVFFTAQQTADDLRRDGMVGPYFPTIYNWLRAEGFAIVHDYLAKYAIPDALNPAVGCQRAPRTSSTTQAIAAGMGPIAEEIADWIAEGRPGFLGGWISRTMLSRALKMERSRISIRAQREILLSLGYVPHPALKGRTDNVVMPDGTKADLYIAEGHLALQLETVAGVAKTYESAQHPLVAAFGEAKA